MTRLVFISDTHGMHRCMTHPVPDGDVLVHCGDMTGHGTDLETIDVANWLGDQDHEHKLAIGGNHDGALEADDGYLRQVFAECGVLYLQDTAVDLEGIKFWGAPWTPNFMNWHFMPERNSPELKAKWDLIPNDTQVLITHGPPHGVLDSYIDAAGRVHVGCELLRARLRSLSDLKVHAFGHIHEGYGEGCDNLSITPGGAMVRRLHYVNAATCTRDYIPSNRPIVVDV